MGGQARIGGKGAFFEPGRGTGRGGIIGSKPYRDRFRRRTEAPKQEEKEEVIPPGSGGEGRVRPGGSRPRKGSRPGGGTRSEAPEPGEQAQGVDSYRNGRRGGTGDPNPGKGETVAPTPGGRERGACPSRGLPAFEEKEDHPGGPKENPRTGQKGSGVKSGRPSARRERPRPMVG